MAENEVEIQDPVIIKLDPGWFKHGYYVYVVVVKHLQDIYYYIGMTGDRKYLIARSPFYRMSGHFMMAESSTQNQIIKGLKERLGNSLKERVGSLLCEMEFTYYMWLIKPYEMQIDKNLHHDNRKIAERIESALIEKCRYAFGEKNVFNETISRKDFGANEIVVAEQILEKLKEYIKSA